MYGRRINSLFLIVFILTLFLLLSGCQAPEALPEILDLENEPQENEAISIEEKKVTDEVIENVNGLENEKFSPNTLLTLSFTAGDFIISADNNFLYFTIPSAPGSLYHLIDLTAAEVDLQSTPKIEWEAIEALPTPSIIGNTYHLQITADSSNLLYTTSEILWDETEYGQKTVIYFSRPDFPPDIYDQVEFTGDEVPFANNGSVIEPFWNEGNNKVFYLTPSGIYKYSTEDRKQTLIRPAEELAGLVWEGHLAPHAFYLESGKKELAYYSDGTIYLVSLVNRTSKPEKIIIDQGDRDFVGIDYLFDGSYLILKDGYAKSGYWLDDLSLTFVNRHSGEVIMEDNDYLPAGYNLDDQGRMFFKSRGPDKEGYFVLLDSNFIEHSRVPARDIVPDETFLSFTNVIRLDEHWALPVFIEMETHFIEINFD